MKKYGQRAVAVLLCFILAFSCMVVPASAFSWTVVLEWLGGADAALGIIEKLANFASGKSDDHTQYLSPDSYLNTVGTRYQVDISVLADLAFDWNQNYAKDAGFGVDVVDITMDTGEIYSVIMCRFSTGGGGRSGGTRGRMCFADGNGRVLYSDATTETSGRWVSRSEAQKVYQLMSYEDLHNLATDVGGMIRLSGDYYIITGPLGTNVYCNTAGRQFAAIAKKDSAAINQDRPTSTGSATEGNVTNNYISNEYIDEGDTFYTYDTTNNTYNTTNETYETIINNIEEGDTYYVKEGDTYYEIVYDYSMDIDIENMTQVQPGGTLNQIENLIYDENTKTYYVDSHDVTNSTTNFYLYQYHINYTSVTYIGQTEEYEKQYELYYELPDGRDSADLTLEDLEQLSTSFKDVMNYARSADDLSQRALYHFDGNTEDSSYWSYASSFDWAKGASLTYMDEGTFGGSLYLDETEHDFTLTLPANDAAGNFTLQFRYYQSYTAAPVMDSYITIGGVKVLQFDGAKYYTGSGTAITATSIGSWNELCFMRKDGVLHYYINGVPYGSMTASIGTSAVRFYFGSTQQTYKKLDELRFTRGAIYTAGENYTPTSVPYDSNLSLVLPDGRIPLADEVLELKPTTSRNFYDDTSVTDWSDTSVISRLKAAPVLSDWSSALFSGQNKNLFYNSSYTSFSAGEGFVTMSSPSNVSTVKVEAFSHKYNITPFMQIGSGLFHPVCGYTYSYSDDSYATSYRNVQVGADYCLSVVLADGSYSSVVFCATDYYTCVIRDKLINSVVDFEVVDLYSQKDSYDTEYFHRLGIRIFLNGATSADIIYMESANKKSSPN